MSLKIKVYSDYVCPFCFLVKHPFEEAIEGKDVEVEWMPYELRPEPMPKLDPVNDPSKLQLWEKYINPAIKELGINMKLPNVSPHPYTGITFEGFHYANEYGKGKEYNDKVFKAFYQEERNIGDIEVIVSLLNELGFDVENCRQILSSGKYKELQKQAIRYAQNEANIQVVPTFIIGDTIIKGMASKEEFENAIRRELGDK